MNTLIRSIEAEYRRYKALAEAALEQARMLLSPSPARRVETRWPPSAGT